MRVAQSETTRENTCVAEIKREKKKKNCTVTDSNSDRHRFLFFIFYFFQKTQVREND